MDTQTTKPNLDEFLGTPQPTRWRRWRKWILIGVPLLIAILLLARCYTATTPVEYSTADAQTGALTVTVSATGKLAPTNQVQVGSEISGLVDQVLVDVNDRVTKGQVLAVINTEQLDDQIRQGQAQVSANQAQVATAQATLQEARAQLGRQEEVFRLSGGRVPSKIEMDQARAAVARGVAGVRAAQAQVEAARAQLSTNVTQRSRAVIRSSVNGVVLARQIEPGQTVASSFNTPTLFVIAEDLSEVELQVAIDEADVGQVKEGQRATFTVDAFPGRTFPASIARVDLGSNLSAQATSTSSTSTASTTGQVVSYAANLTVANPDLQLRPGMTATAEIVTMHKDRALLIPNAALRFTPAAAGATQQSASIVGQLGPPRRRNERERSTRVSRGAQQTVHILGEDGKPQPVNVVTGDTNGSMTEVIGGDLKAGQKVITGQMAAGGSGGQRRQGGGQGKGCGGNRGQ